jgi:hypothetical protein
MQSDAPTKLAEDALELGAAIHQQLIDAIANAHIGCPMSEEDAHRLLVILGMDSDEAEDLLTAQREEAGDE